MISPRWRKVFRDLWGNKVRTLLVVSSIAVGIFAVGLIAGTNVLLSRELTQSYLSVNPASAVLYTDAFDEELVNVVRRMPEVRDAEGRRSVTVRLQVADDEWRNMTLFVLSDYDDVRIDQVRPEEGVWGPSHRELMLERASVGIARAEIGDTVRIETPEGRLRELRIVGLTHDLNQFPTPLSGVAYGYITFDTLEWLGWPRSFNELHVVASGNPYDPRETANVRHNAELVREKVEKSGRVVHWTWLPTPGKHPADDVIQPLLLILGVLGLLSLVMSGFLVANTLAAILTQHIRQIGVMKAIGARTPQVMGMYFGMVFTLSLLALSVGIPAASLGARLITDFMAGLVNFDVQSYHLPVGVLLLEVGVGLVVPLMAATYPILWGARLTVREAISDQGPGQGGYGQGWVDRIVERFRGLSRPLLLSLRNTFRRKGRLVMTLVTLTLGGAIFIGVMSVHQSLLLTLDEALNYWNYDVSVQFGRAYRVEQIERETGRVPGVVSAESWGLNSARLQRPDGTESGNYQLVAPPTGSQMILPELLAGRWLVPEDENAIVVNSDVLKDETELQVGDDVTLKIAGRDTDWRIVGVVRSALSGPSVYANYEYYSRVVRSVGRSGNVRVLTHATDPAELNRMANALQEHFEAVGMQVRSTQTIAQVREPILFQFNILVVFLLIMATLLAVVGALGLTGTMSINVLERIREIGVMRAIGASSRSIMQLVIVEGVLIALISWMLGSLLAVPLSRLLSHIVGVAFMQSPLSYTFSEVGLLLWLGIVLALAGLASLLPAWNASRLTVRDVLAYE